MTERENTDCRLEAVRGDITRVTDVDAIVNAANESLLGGAAGGRRHPPGGRAAASGGMPDAERLSDRSGKNHRGLSSALPVCDPHAPDPSGGEGSIRRENFWLPATVPAWSWRPARESGGSPFPPSPREFIISR